jgi:hypothetical protein
MEQLTFRKVLNGENIQEVFWDKPVLEMFLKCMCRWGDMYEYKGNLNDIEDIKDEFVDEYDYLPIPTIYKVSIIDYDGYNELECYKYEILNDVHKIQEKYCNYLLQRGYVLKNKIYL